MCVCDESISALFESWERCFKEVKASTTLLEAQRPLLELFNIVKALRTLVITKEQQASARKVELQAKIHALLEEKVTLRKNQRHVPKGCACGRGKLVKVCVSCICVKNNRPCNEHCGCNADGKECQHNNLEEIDPVEEEFETFFVSDNDEEMMVSS